LSLPFLADCVAEFSPSTKLSERGGGLLAGTVVMTGTLTPILPIEAGSTYVGRFATLGVVEKSFA
jgi:2-keto-4-pentenoate hydratase